MWKMSMLMTGKRCLMTWENVQDATVFWVRDWVWSQTVWVQILYPPLISCVTLGKLVTLSVPIS